MHRAAALLVVPFAVLVATADTAWPCIHAITVKDNLAVKALESAEKALAKGELKGVFDLLDPKGIYEAVASGSFEFEDAAVRRRAMLVLATAAVRLGGTYVARGTELLGAMHDAAKEEKTEEPVVVARYAEALAKSESSAAEASKLLEDLAARDLVAEAHGWAALAKLRAGAGDAAGGDAAAERCRAMTTLKGVCPAAAPAKTASKAAPAS